MMSGLPSPLRSATATERGCSPTAKVAWGWKVPSPLPRSTLTRARPLVGDDDVGLAVAIEVGHDNGLGVLAHGEGFGRGEGAVAVAEEHADAAVALIGDDDVGYAVAIDVGHGHGDRVEPRRRRR